MKAEWVSLVVLFFASQAAVAQETVGQARFIFHPTKQITKRVFTTAWIIGNVRQKANDNVNLFAGIGYRGNKWWVETMLQKQWNRTGGEVGLDFRFQAAIGNRGMLYLEPTIFLRNRGLYEFAIFEYRAIGKLNLGIETENIHRKGKDSLGVGPRASYPVWQNKKGKFVLVGAYRIRHHEPNEARMYLIYHLNL